MTPGMQIRLWLRTAARSQVVTTCAVLAAVLALLLSSISRGSDNDQLSAFEGQVGIGVPADGTSAPAGTESDGAGAPTGSSGPAAAGVPSAVSATDSPLVLGSNETASTGNSGSSGLTATTPTPSTTGSSATGGQQSPSSSVGAPRAASTDISKATDRGVNNCGAAAGPCVKLGFLLAKIGGIDQSGQAFGLRNDISQVIDAYVAYQNKQGGILGRRIVAEKRPTDTISQSDQLQACTEFTQDKKVFGVIDTTSLIFANTQQCFIQDNKTPLVHSYAESEAFMDAGKGYDVTTLRSLDRIAFQWADEIGKLGFLKGGEKVGILQDNCEPSNSVIRKVLIAGIMKYRPASVESYETDCSAASAQAQPPALQNQMCVDGVTHVLLATSFVAAQTFLQSADGGPCGTGDRKYRYMASDYSLLANDLRTRNFPARQFDGSLAVTNLFTGIAAPSAQNQLCSKILKDAGLPGVDNGYRHAEATAICDYFFIMVRTAEAVGTNLTRASWAQASQRRWTFKGAYVAESRYGPGKTSGGELVHAMTWRADCTCYRSSGPLHVGAG